MACVLTLCVSGFWRKAIGNVQVVFSVMLWINMFNKFPFVFKVNIHWFSNRMEHTAHDPSNIHEALLLLQTFYIERLSVCFSLYSMHVYSGTREKKTLNKISPSRISSISHIADDDDIVYNNGLR